MKKQKHDKSVLTVVQESHSADKNVSDSSVEIIDSKSRLIYRDFIMRRHYGSVCWSSFAFFLSFLIPLLTADFHDIFNAPHSGTFIKYTFYILCIASIISFVYFLIRWLFARKEYSEDAFIDALHGKKKR